MELCAEEGGSFADDSKTGKGFGVSADSSVSITIASGRQTSSSPSRTSG